MASKPFTESAEKSAKWLISKMDDDGCIGPTLYFYDKVPHALMDAGYIKEAISSLKWIQKHGMRKNNDFDFSKDPEAGDERGRIWAPRMRPYQNAILVMSGQRLGRFDFSYRAYNRMLRYQDTEVGGFCHSMPEGAEFDLVSTGFCGLACIYMGDILHAKMAGDAVLTLIEKQPDIKNRLYVNLDRNNELITAKYPVAGEDFYIVHRDRKDQMYFYAGVGVTLLSKLHLATGEQKYLDGAIALHDFNISCRSVFNHGSAGKFAWGCLYLYDATGNEKYLDTSRRIGEFILGMQGDDGCYVIPGHSHDARFTITAELTMWVSEISRYLE